MATFHAWKLVGAGNDFLAFDARHGDTTQWRHIAAQVARWVCRRRFGLGADGILLLLKPDDAARNGRMMYLNADGSIAGFCGNGTRCLALATSYWASHHDGARLSPDKLNAPTEHKVTLELDSGIAKADILPDGRVTLSLPPARWIEGPKLVRTETQSLPWDGDWIDAGVPHFVVKVSGGAGSLDRLEIRRHGAALRHHEAFGADGANVTFLADVPEDFAAPLRQRTFERGVEGETLGCGSGAVSSAASWIRRTGKARGEVTIRTRSGSPLTISGAWKDNQFVDIKMTGEAKWIASVTLTIPEGILAGDAVPMEPQVG